MKLAIKNVKFDGSYSYNANVNDELDAYLAKLFLNQSPLDAKRNSPLTAEILVGYLFYEYMSK